MFLAIKNKQAFKCLHVKNHNNFQLIVDNKTRNVFYYKKINEHLHIENHKHFELVVDDKARNTFKEQKC
jgi:phosphotransferase system IIB component